MKHQHVLQNLIGFGADGAALLTKYLFDLYAHYTRVRLFHVEQKQRRRYFDPATGRGQESAVKQQAQMLARQVQDALKAKENADAPVSVLNAELTATNNALQQAKARMDEEKESREEAMETVSQLRGAIDDVRAEVASSQHISES
ncbi:hypothetical protein BSKO_00242 [Bryopsis sp. KO-2023]|nr:hypothetical protein BSKO_00242 [Bryopsis sp. KO-2023]